MPKNDKKDLMDALIRLTLMNVPVSEAAKRLGVNVNTCYNWAKTDTYKMKLDAARAAVFAEVDAKIADVHARLTEFAVPKALDTMISLLDSEKESIKARAAADLMDRDNRLSKTRKVESTVTHNFLTPSILRELSRVAYELRTADPNRVALPPAKKNEVIDMNTENPTDAIYTSEVTK